MAGDLFDNSAKKGATLEKLVEVLFKRARFPVVERDKKIPDGTGTPAQVDVYVETEEGQKILVECKHREIEQDRINKEVFEKLESRVRRLGADRGLVVTDASVSERYSEFEKYCIYFWDNKEFLELSSKEGKSLTGDIYTKLQLTSEEQKSTSHASSLLNLIKQIPLKYAIAITLILFACLSIFSYVYQEEIIGIIKTIIALIKLTLTLTLIFLLLKILQVFGLYEPSSTMAPKKSKRRKKTKRKSSRKHKVNIEFDVD